MKKSIKIKLFLGISLLGIFFISISWILNTQYLENYYIEKKKNMLLKSSEGIDEIYKGNPDDISLELEKIESKVGSYIFIFNKEKGILYSSFFNPFNEPDREKQVKAPLKLRIRRLPRLLPFHPPEDDEFITQKYVFDITKDPQLKTEFLSLRFILNNGDMLAFVTPLAAVSESVDIANDFYLYTGIFIIGLGTVFAFVFSEKFTKPILEINDIARHMAKLDFSKKCNITRKDEVGQLAKSINYLSEQLEDAIFQLNERNKKLEKDIERERRIDEMRKEFISSVSHELKTPIALIQGYAEGLKYNINEDEENKNYYCDVIIDESKKMDKLIKDLLNLSKLESGYFKLERSIFNISSLIDRILEKYRPVFEENDITLLVEKEKDVFVNGDILRIEQVLINYIDNAIKQIEEERIIKLTVQNMNDKVRVSVYNSGKWIPEESMDKIWTSFYKLDKARTRAHGGYGLGLSIVKSILQLHKNGYGARNVEGGVEFWFELDKVI